MSQSAIYEGTIRHRRFAVRKHEFRYRIAMAYIDLDELPDAARRPPHAHAPRARALPPQRLPRRPGDPARPSRPQRSSQARLGSAPAGPDPPAHPPPHLRPLLQPGELLLLLRARRRTASRRSSPRSPTRRGASATPTCSQAGDPIPRGGFDKALHVSPFMPMDQRYTWRAPAPGPTLSVQIESSAGRPQGLRRDARPQAPPADPALARCAAPGGDARHARADLRPRRRAEAQGRPRPTPPRPMTATRRTPARHGAPPAHPRRPADRDRGRQRDGLRLGRPAGDRARALPESVAAARARQPRHGQLLHRRPVGHARPHRGHPRRRAQRPAHRRGPPPHLLRPRALPARPRRVHAQHAAARPQGHRRPLRPRQRAVRADARPDADVLVRRVRAPRRDARGGLDRQARARVREARPRPARPRRRDRDGLGRVRGLRRDHARLPRHHDDDLAGAARRRREARQRGQASSTSSTSGSTTTATCAAPTTSSSRSR